MRVKGFGLWRLVRAWRSLRRISAGAVGVSNIPDISEEDKATIHRVMPYTQTSVERIYAVIQAVRYIENSEIKGSIVECGVWRGGSMMAALNALLELNSQGRDIYLFDTFEGMTEPGVEDVSIRGESMTDEFVRKTSGGENWCGVSMDEVKCNILSMGYPLSKTHFIKGRVEDTLPLDSPNEIALLRLDTDWYESTRHELVHLFPRLAVGGIIIIDDYGHYSGAKLAVDEYFAENKINIFLSRIDYTGRIGVKI